MRTKVSQSSDRRDTFALRCISVVVARFRQGIAASDPYLLAVPHIFKAQRYSGSMLRDANARDISCSLKLPHSPVALRLLTSRYLHST